MKKKIKKVNAAILIIGNEILSGRTQDKNVIFLTNWLNLKCGISVKEVRIIIVTKKLSDGNNKVNQVKADVTQSISNNDRESVSSDGDNTAISLNRRALFTKEVKRVAATGILHDEPKFDNLKWCTIHDYISKISFNR